VMSETGQSRVPSYGSWRISLILANDLARGKIVPCHRTCRMPAILSEDMSEDRCYDKNLARAPKRPTTSLAVSKSASLLSHALHELSRAL
jgi:hypothetical protein